VRSFKRSEKAGQGSGGEHENYHHYDHDLGGGKRRALCREQDRLHHFFMTAVRHRWLQKNSDCDLKSTACSGEE